MGKVLLRLGAFAGMTALFAALGALLVCFGWALGSFATWTILNDRRG